MADTIRLGIYDEHKIVQEGICALLQTVEDIEIVLKADQRDQYWQILKAHPGSCIDHSTCII